jgi:hypothetical protein
MNTKNDTLRTRIRFHPIDKEVPEWAEYGYIVVVNKTIRGNIYSLFVGNTSNHVNTAKDLGFEKNDATIVGGGLATVTRSTDGLAVELINGSGTFGGIPAEVQERFATKLKRALTLDGIPVTSATSQVDEYYVPKNPHWNQ